MTTIFPSATDREREGGWTLSVEFLKAIQTAAVQLGCDTCPSLEQIEAILLAANAHALTTVPQAEAKP